MERISSGLLMLQELTPKSLIGSLCSVIDERGVGWVYGSFFTDIEGFSVDEGGEEIRLLLGRTVAISLIGLMHVLISTNQHLRGTISDHGKPCMSKFHVSGGEMQLPLICQWTPDLDRIRASRAADSQLELWFREDAANDLAYALENRLGEIAAVGLARRSSTPAT